MCTRCFKCGGPYHPATGHVFKIDVVYCGRCAREFFFGYYRPRMIQMNHRKGRQLENFNLAASTSIGARR